MDPLMVSRLVLVASILAAVIGAIVLANNGRNEWSWMLVYALIGMLCMTDTTVITVTISESNQKTEKNGGS